MFTGDFSFFQRPIAIRNFCRVRLGAINAFCVFFNCHHELHHADAAATAPTGAVTSLQIGPWHAGQAQCSGNHLGHPSVLSPRRRTQGIPWPQPAAALAWSSSLLRCTNQWSGQLDDLHKSSLWLRKQPYFTTFNPRNQCCWCASSLIRRLKPSKHDLPPRKPLFQKAIIANLVLRVLQNSSQALVSMNLCGVIPKKAS